MATQLKNIISAFLKEKHKEILKKEELKELVDRLLSPDIKKHVRFGKVYKKKLILYVDSSTALYQLNLLKNKILEETRLTSSDIERVIIKIGSI